MKLSKKSWLTIVLILVTCVSSLQGTIAWFTDEVTSGSNIVASGSLKAEMAWTNGTKAPANASWQDASTGAIFDYALWEPGYAVARHLHISNVGDLAFQYKLQIASGAEVSKLADAIDVYCIAPAQQLSSREDLAAYTPVGTLTDALAGLRLNAAAALLPGEDATVTIALKMREDAGNEYMNMSIGSDFAVQLLATQYAYEEDSFGSDYDAEAVFGNNFKYFNASAIVPGVDGNGRMTKAVTIGDTADPMKAYVPAGTKLVPGTKSLRMTISRIEHRDYSIPMNDGQLSTSYDVHIEGIADDNDKYITVDMGSILPKGLKDASVQYYHVENGTPKKMKLVDSLSGGNQFTYDAATGRVTLALCTFSEITQLVDANDPWDGTVDTSWYDASKSEFVLTEEEQLAGLGKLVAEGNSFAGKTIKLGANMDLNAEAGRVFLPIGYSESNPNTLGTFEGTFDGDGNVIRDLYQNTWAIKGNYDNGYYNKSMGLFGMINQSATVKNLILYRFNMEGEFAPMGCVAGRAMGGTFENIQLIECHPATYNTGVGGMIGWDYGDGANCTYNFNNITIDQSNTIGALWGTYDAGVGGIMGYLSEDSTANFTNCSIGAVLDVYNDVCANYQYYQYRYSGMLIGTVGRDGTPDTSKIHCTDVYVHYDDWVHNFYCEFEKNSQASYTEDFQFSRIPHSELNFTDSNGNGRVDEAELDSVTGCAHVHTSREQKENQAVHLPFRQLLTGYGWGASPVTELPGVTIQPYGYTITYKNGTETLLTEYVRQNSGEKTIKYTAWTEGNYRWVNAGGTSVTSIDAANGENVVLYVDHIDSYVARFVDQFGNVIAEVPFNEGDTALPEPAVPAVPTVEGGFVGSWGEYSLSKGDVTIKPVYSLDSGAVKLEPVDNNQDGITDQYRVVGVDRGDPNVAVPPYVNGIPVTEITDGAFAEFSDITDIDLPNTLTYIGADAFADRGGIVPDYETVQIFFDGTRAEWDALLEKSSDDWDQYVGVGSVIVCKQQIPAGYYQLTEGWIPGRTFASWKWVEGEYYRQSNNETTTN